jgi:tRNA pseudouridine13 synthase
MEVTASGGKFVVADARAEQAPFDRCETVLTGPLFGPKMTPPTGEPAEREQRILSTWKLTEADFERFAQLTSGTRRPFLVWPTDPCVNPDPHGLRLDFTLPSGAYATTFLGELMKTG